MKRWKKSVLISIFSSLLFDQQAVEAAVSICKPDPITGAAVSPPLAGAYPLGSHLDARNDTMSRKVPTELALVADMNELDNANEVNHAPPGSDWMQTAFDYFDHFDQTDEVSSEHQVYAEQKEMATNPVWAMLQQKPLLSSRSDLPPALSQQIVQSAEAMQRQTLSEASTATEDARAEEAAETQESSRQTQVTQSQTEMIQTPSVQPTPQTHSIQTAQTQTTPSTQIQSQSQVQTQTQSQPQIPKQPTRTQERNPSNQASNSGPTMLPSSGATATRGGRLVAIAKQYLGAPYCYGGTSPSGFDCSGFTQYVFRQAGIDLPRTTYSQVNAGAPVSKQNLQPGDIVFFACGGQATSHCGLYIGNGQFIHADLTRGIAIADLNSAYWSGVYQTAVRAQ